MFWSGRPSEGPMLELGWLSSGVRLLFMLELVGVRLVYRLLLDS